MSNQNRIIYSKTSKKENGNYYVKEEDFTIGRGESDWIPTIEFQKKIQESSINGKLIPEQLSYQNLSLWWIIIQSLEPNLKKTINFLNKFLKLVDEVNPDSIKIEEDFSYFDIIQQICQQKNIKLEYSSTSILKNKLSKKSFKKIQKIRHKKIIENKLQKRKQIFKKKNHSNLEINETIVFAIPTYLRRYVFNITKKTTERGEYIQQGIIDLLKNKENVLYIDIDYTFKGDFDILLERINESKKWIPLEVLLDIDFSKNTSHKNFFKNYDKLIMNKQFQNLFIINNISIWSQVEDIFNMMIFQSYLPFYLLVLDSLLTWFNKNKPKVVFLSYESGPLALILIAVCKNFGIKTIGIQHAFIYENNPMYSHNEFASKVNPYAFPLPDYTLVFGEFTKNLLVKNGYPKEQIVVIGHPAFFHIEKIVQALENKSLLKKYKIPSNSKVILFATGKLQKNYPETGKYDHDEQIWRNLLDSYSNNKEFFLILKPHPLESNITVYEEILKEYDTDNAKIIQGDLFELIYLSSIVISVFSSTMLDSLCFGKPVIRVNFGRETLSIIDTSKAIISSELSQLTTNIEKILNDVDLQREMKKTASSFVKEQYGIPQKEPEKILEKLLS